MEVVKCFRQIGYVFFKLAIELRVRPVEWDLDLNLDLRPVDLALDVDLTISESENLDSDLEEENLDLPLWDLTTSLI